MIHCLTKGSVDLFQRGSVCSFMINEFNSLGKICSIKFYLTDAIDNKNSSKSKWYINLNISLRILYTFLYKQVSSSRYCL